jgi:hypothetical protein
MELHTWHTWSDTVTVPRNWSPRDEVAPLIILNGATGKSPVELNVIARCEDVGWATPTGERGDGKGRETGAVKKVFTRITVGGTLIRTGKTAR